MQYSLRLLQDPRRWNLVLVAVLFLGTFWIWQSAVPAAATTVRLVPTLPGRDAGD